VLDASAIIRNRYSLPPEPRGAVIAESLRRRIKSVRRAWSGLSVDGNVYAIQNVYDASIVAGALWNYRCGTGHLEGRSLFADRLTSFIAKRLRHSSAT
jgi:hypothetical protein